RPVRSGAKVQWRVSRPGASDVNACDPKRAPFPDPHARTPAISSVLAAWRGWRPQVLVLGMPPDVGVDELALGDDPPVSAAHVVERGLRELRAVALALVLRGHARMRQDPHRAMVLVLQPAGGLSAVAQFIAPLRLVVGHRGLGHSVAPCMADTSMWKPGSNRAFSTTPPGAEPRGLARTRVAPIR